MPPRAVRAIIVLASSMVVGCGGGSSPGPSSPTSPSPIPTVPLSLTGTWTGTATDLPNGHSFGVTMTLAQSGNSLTGSWTTATGNSGSLTGQVSGSTVVITALNVDGEPDCSTRFDAQRDGENRLAGTFEGGAACSMFARGRFELSRQSGGLNCAGTPVGRVEINVNAPVTMQVYGETLSAQNASGQSPFRVTRDVVPCEYVITGRLASPPGPILLEFTRTSPYERDANPGGVDRGSIVVEVGERQDVAPCQISVRGAGTGLADFRVRFRVIASNTSACQ